jgi:sterol-4alpha-carboxylate 3-dehydrogenase (decarboxylating)
MDSTPTLQPLGSALVIGGTDFIGTHVVEAFPDQPGCTAVHVLSRKPPRNSLPKVEYNEGYINDLEKLKHTINKINPSIIANLAYPGNLAPEKVLREVIIQGNNSILQCAAENPAVESFIYISTAEVVRKTGQELTEDTCQIWNESSWENPYGKTKAIAETLTLKANSPSLGTISLRSRPYTAKGIRC